MVKNPPSNAGDARDTDQADPLEGEMATHASNLAWKIPWTREDPGGLHGVSKSRTQLSGFARTHATSEIIMVSSCSLLLPTAGQAVL